MTIQARVLQNVKWAQDNEAIYFEKDQIVSLLPEEIAQYPDVFISVEEEKRREEQKEKEPVPMSSDERHHLMKAQLMESDRIAREAHALFLEREAQQNAEYAKAAAARLRSVSKPAKA